MLTNTSLSDDINKNKQQQISIKQKQKEDKKYQKQVIKKNKKLIKNYKKYPECRGDENCIKIKQIIDENNEEEKNYKQNIKIKLNDKVMKLKKITKIDKKKTNKNTKNIISNKKIDRKIIKQKKQNIKKIEKMEFLNDKQILDLIDEQQYMITNKKEIKVATKNKGVPLICLGRTIVSSKNKNANNNKAESKELKEAKNNLEKHIEQSLILNGVSKELIKYIIDNLDYIKFTAKKNKTLQNRTMIDSVNKRKVEDLAKLGLKYKNKYLKELLEVEKLFNVNPEIILTIWGMETIYGAYTGNFDAFNALYSACLNANTINRLRYFENNIISLAILVDMGYFKKDVLASFDGGLGGCQFMPDSFYKFAVSLDGTKTDIINKNEDVIASIGNYLHSVGWRYNEGILTEIKMPDIDPCLIGLNTSKTIEEWKNLGIKPHENNIGIDYFYDDKAKASIIITDVNNDEIQNKRAFLVYDNYKVILGYNQHIVYGITSGLIFELIRKQII